MNSFLFTLRTEVIIITLATLVSDTNNRAFTTVTNDVRMHLAFFFLVSKTRQTSINKLLNLLLSLLNFFIEALVAEITCLNAEVTGLAIGLNL